MTSGEPSFQPKLREELVTQINNLSRGNDEITNIFDYYSKEALITLKNACEETKKQKLSTLTPFGLLAGLASKNSKVNVMEKEDLLKIKEETIKQMVNPEDEFKGYVYFS